MKPSVISFNGLGAPSPAHITTGHVAILVRDGKKEVVRIELLPPEEYGPRLHHATNQEQLSEEVERFWRTLDVMHLEGERDWLVDCPEAIAAIATFCERGS